MFLKGREWVRKESGGKGKEREGEREKAEKGGDVEMRHFSYMHMNTYSCGS